MQFPSIDLISASFVSVIVRSVGAVAALALTWVLTRQFGPEASGMFFLAFAIITFAGTFSRAGLDATIVRFVGAAGSLNEGARVTDVLTKAVIFSAPLTIFTGLSLFFGTELIAIHVFDKPALSETLRAMCFALIGINLLTIVGMGLQGLRQTISSVVILKIAAPLICIVILATVPTDEISAAGLYYAAAAALAGILGIAAFIHLKPQNNHGSVMQWTTLTASSRPLWAGLIAQQITLLSSQVLCGVWLSSGDVALLTVAQRVAMLTSFILLAVNMVVAPRFAALHNENKGDELQRLTLDTTKLMLLVGIPIAALVLFFAHNLMGQFGQGFDSGGLALQIITLGQLVNIATGSANILLISTGNEDTLKRSHYAGATVALALGVTLIPAYGVVGGAAATARAIATQNLLTVFLVKKHTGIHLILNNSRP